MESVKKSNSLEKRFKKFAEKYQKLGCNNWQEALEYENNKLDQLLNKKSLS